MKLEELPDGTAGKARLSPSESAAQQHREALIEQEIEYDQAREYISTYPRTPSKDDTTPNLPPGLAAVKNKSAEEVLADLNKMPLFMTSLEDNDDVDALKALAYEGSPLEVASGFKERGNDSYKEKGWKDAKEFYTKGIQVLLVEVRKRQNGEDPSADKEEVQKEIAVLEACLVNRAACHLELKNYRSCVMDCGSAIKINRKNIKAYFRSTKALLALDKFADADDACGKGLEIEPENKALQGLLKEINKGKLRLEENKRKEIERDTRKRSEDTLLKVALAARNIKTRNTGNPLDFDGVKVELVPDPLDPSSSLSFPTLLLYPLAHQSDFLAGFNEQETLEECLPEFFPLPWDERGEYSASGVVCYMETVTGGLIKFGKKVPLLKILSQANVEVIDDLVKIFVVPRANADAWIKSYKQLNSAEKAETSKLP